MALSAKGLFLLMVAISLIYLAIAAYNQKTSQSSSDHPVAQSIPVVSKPPIVATPPATVISQSLSNTTPVDLNLNSLHCGSIPSINLAALEKLTFDLINGERSIHNLNSLNWNDLISLTARDHSTDMGLSGYFSHQDLSGNYADKRLQDHGYKSFEIEGENLALLPAYPYYYTYSNGTTCAPFYYNLTDLAQLAVTSWMNSPEHKANILLPNFTDSGMGIYYTNNSYYFTQEFVKYTECGYANATCCPDGQNYYCYQPYNCDQQGNSFVCN